MMKSKDISICFELGSPLQIGYLPNEKGNVVARTRFYVPGINIFGGAVCRAVEEMLQDKKLYETIKSIFKNITFSYFYIIDEKNNILAPVYTESKGLIFGGMPRDEFEYLYIGSRMATAKTPEGGTKESSLHENEFILDRRRDGAVTKIAGLIMVNENGLAEDSKKAKIEISVSDSDILINGQSLFKRLTIGGNQNYGLGELNKANCQNELNEKLQKFYSYAGQNEFKAGEDIVLKTHCNFNEGAYHRGAIEIVAGRSTNDINRKGHHIDVEENPYYFAPGTLVNFSGNTKYRVDNYGKIIVSG